MERRAAILGKFCEFIRYVLSLICYAAPTRPTIPAGALSPYSQPPQAAAAAAAAASPAAAARPGTSNLLLSLPKCRALIKELLEDVRALCVNADREQCVGLLMVHTYACSPVLFHVHFTCGNFT